jgi:hypothetical protein
MTRRDRIASGPGGGAGTSGGGWEGRSISGNIGGSGWWPQGWVRCGAEREVARLCKLRAGAARCGDRLERMLQAVSDGEGKVLSSRCRMGRRLVGGFADGGVRWAAPSTQLAKLRYFLLFPPLLQQDQDHVVDVRSAGEHHDQLVPGRRSNQRAGTFAEPGISTSLQMTAWVSRQAFTARVSSRLPRWSADRDHRRRR